MYNLSLFWLEARVRLLRNYRNLILENLELQQQTVALKRRVSGELIRWLIFLVIALRSRNIG
jgi:hypothetical protein